MVLAIYKIKVQIRLQPRLSTCSLAHVLTLYHCVNPVIGSPRQEELTFQRVGNTFGYNQVFLCDLLFEEHSVQPGLSLRVPEEDKETCVRYKIYIIFYHKSQISRGSCHCSLCSSNKIARYKRLKQPCITVTHYTTGKKWQIQMFSNSWQGTSTFSGLSDGQ